MTAERPWHQALAYAITGHRLEGLGQQAHPDVTALAAELEARVARGEVTVARANVAAVPEDLLAGLGAAQFRAALSGLQRALDGTGPSGVVSDRPLTADERRLQQDRPPHHGS